MDAPSGSSVVQAVAVSTVAWTALFVLFIYLQPHRSYGWNSRMVACIHGLTVSVMSLALGIWYNQSAFTQPGGVSNFFEVIILATCLGYFVHDTVFCLAFHVYGHDTYITAVHHGVTMAGMVTSLWMGVSGTEISVAIGLMECTNPMLQVRWFLRQMGARKGNAWYELNDLAFVFSFGVIRGVIAQYLTYCVAMHPQPANSIKFFAVAVGVMNAILVVGIMEYALKRYTTMWRQWKRGVSADEAMKESQVKSALNENQLSGNTDTFEEITMHKEFVSRLKNIQQQFLFKNNKI